MQLIGWCCLALQGGVAVYSRLKLIQNVFNALVGIVRQSWLIFDKSLSKMCLPSSLPCVDHAHCKFSQYVELVLMLSLECNLAFEPPVDTHYSFNPPQGPYLPSYRNITHLGEYIKKKYSTFKERSFIHTFIIKGSTLLSLQKCGVGYKSLIFLIRN